MSSEVEWEIPPANEGDKAAVLQVLADYQAAFSGHSPQSAQLFYHKPCMVIDAQRVVVLSSGAEIEAFFTSMMQRLEARRWHHSQWKDVSAEQLNDSAVLVSTVAVRYMADGKELERVGSTYVFQKTDLDWKIAVTIAHPPNKMLHFNASLFS
jgi:hypothetical protein